MRWNLIGAFIRNHPFGTEIAFKKGLELIGESVTTIDPSYPNQVFDYDADVTVLFKYIEDETYKKMLKCTSGLKIVYQPDDLRFPHIKKMMVEMLEYFDYAFTFDNDGAELAKSYGYRDAQRLLLTADNTLYRHIKMQKDIDVCFIGSMSNGENHKSRMKMVDIVKKIPRVKFICANEIFDINAINTIYNRSKIILNHATDVGQEFGHGYGYQCRHFEAGFTKSCVLSNRIDNENVLKGVIEFYSVESLVDSIDFLLKNTDIIEDYAHTLYSHLNAYHTPEKRAIEMLQFVKAIP